MRGQCLNIFIFSISKGAYFAWKATAMGKNYVNGKTFLEKRYFAGKLFANLHRHIKPSKHY